MIRKLLIPTLLILALLFVAACGTGSPSSDEATAAPATAVDAPAGTPQTRPTASTRGNSGSEPAEPAAEPAAMGDTRDIKDISSSLDGLRSYRLRFTFSFEGKDEQGKPQQGSMEFVQEVIKASNDRHISFTTTGDAAGTGSQGGSFDLYQIGGTTYIYSPDGGNPQRCIGGMGGDNGGSDLGQAFKPSDIVGGLEKAKLVGRGETVNGIKVDHYSFDQNALTFGAFAAAQGDVWLAQDGGFLVKYVGTATGKNSILSSRMAEGTVTWEYNVQDANQLEAIDLPKECESAKPADDIPVPSNAIDKSGLGRMTTFKTPDPPADVAAFYKRELPAQGWKAGDENAMGELQMLSFSKGSRKLSITITKEEQGGSTVLVSEEPGT